MKKNSSSSTFVFFFTAWLILSLSLYFSFNDRNSLRFIRFFILFSAYLYIFSPLYFSPFLSQKKSTFSSLGASFFLLLINDLLVLWEVRFLPGQLSNLQPNWGILLGVQFSCLFFFFSFGYAIHKIFSSHLFAGFFSAVLGVILFTSLWWGNIASYLGIKISSSVVTFFLYINPFALTAGCFPDYDYLRSGVLYQTTKITDYQFTYPDISLAIYGWIITGVLLLILSDLISRNFKSQNFKPEKELS